MSVQVRLEALKLAVATGDRSDPISLAMAFEKYITEGVLAPKLEIVEDNPEDAPPSNRRHRRHKGR